MKREFLKNSMRQSYTYPREKVILIYYTNVKRKEKLNKNRFYFLYLLRHLRLYEVITSYCFINTFTVFDS